jgi:hypothetical protein
LPQVEVEKGECEFHGNDKTTGGEGIEDVGGDGIWRREVFMF